LGQSEEDRWLHALAMFDVTRFSAFVRAWDLFPLMNTFIMKLLQYDTNNNSSEIEISDLN